MLRLFFLLVISGFIAMPTNAQKVVRYKDDLFNELKILKDISYRPDTENKRFTLDIYMPANDDRKDRPVVVWMHGGGFKFGKKTSRGIPIWCKQFARKGYVCVAINYSLSKEKTLSDPQAFIRGCQRALLDLEAAINFMEAREDEYGIDLRQLILAGNSAGGTMALQAAYGIPNGFLDSISGNELEKKNLPVTAVINYWGAIVDSSWLQTKKFQFIQHWVSMIVLFRQPANQVFYSEGLLFIKSLIGNQFPMR